MLKYPALTTLAHDLDKYGSKPTQGVKFTPFQGLKVALERIVNNLLNNQPDAKTVEARAAQLSGTGLDTLTIILQLIQEFGPLVIKLIQSIRDALGNK